VWPALRAQLGAARRASPGQEPGPTRGSPGVKHSTVSGVQSGLAVRPEGVVRPVRLIEANS